MVRTFLFCAVSLAAIGTTTAAFAAPRASDNHAGSHVKAAAKPIVAKNVVAKNAVAKQAVSWFGINLSGAEFGGLGPDANTAYPGKYGTQYTYPTARELDFYKSRGRRIFRLPFRWERMQPALYAPLDSEQLRMMDEVVDAAAARGMLVLLDCHNYGRYNALSPDGTATVELLLGDEKLPFSAFGDFWKKMAQHYGAGARSKAILGYGLMNEPHDMRRATDWPQAAQAATDAIRSVDKTTAVFVAGDSWSGAHSWRAVNEYLDVKDAANNIVYEAHQYFDENHSGTYVKSYDDEAKNPGFDPQIGARRVAPFLAWCREKKRRGFLGEFGVPGDDARWLVVLDNFLAALNADKTGGTYWSAGPWWPSGDKLALEWGGDTSVERPQTAVLQKYPGGFPIVKPAKP